MHTGAGILFSDHSLEYREARAYEGSEVSPGNMTSALEISGSAA
jgi:hypothetical protein